MKLNYAYAVLFAWAVPLIGCFICQAEENAQQPSAVEVAKQTQDLVDELTKEIESDPQPDPSLYEQRADARMKQKDYRAAFADYSQSIVLKQESRRFPYTSLMRRSVAAVRLGMHEQAILDVKLATKVQPTQPAPFATLAILLAGAPAKFRDPVQSLKLAEFAARFPDDMGQPQLIQAALAAAHSANGNFDKAIEHQEKVVSLSEGKAKEYYESVLARYRKKLGYRLENVDD